MPNSVLAHGVLIERSQSLPEFCVNNDPSIASTMSAHHPRHLCTWTIPDDRYCNQIDFIMRSLRWRSSITLCKTLPSSDSGTDHNLLICEFHPRLKVSTRAKQNHLFYLNFGTLLHFRRNVSISLILPSQRIDPLMRYGCISKTH